MMKMMKIILSEFVKKRPDFSSARLFLNDAGLPESFILALEDECNYSYEYLLTLASKNLSDTDLEKELRLFLSKRWSFIHRTNGSYNCIPHSPINQFCIQLAQAMAGENEPIVTILCPTLSIKEDDYLTGETLIQQTEFMRHRKTQKIIKLRKPMDLNDPDGPKEYVENVIEDDEYDRVGRLNPYAFFISNDGRAVINIKSWFEFQDITSGSPNRNHLYLEHEKVKTLYDFELNMLVKCAQPYSEELFDQFAIISKLESARGTMAESMTRLYLGLKGSGISGAGTAANASDSYIGFVRDFANDLNQISENDRNRVMNMCSIRGDKNFQFFWSAVSGEGRHSQNIQTCTDWNSDGIRGILYTNIQELSRIDINTAHLSKADVQSGSPFELIQSKIFEKLMQRTEAYEAYLNSDTDSEIKKKAGEVATKPFYESKPLYIVERLDAFKRHLSLELCNIASEKELLYWVNATDINHSPIFYEMYNQLSDHLKLECYRKLVVSAPWIASKIISKHLLDIPDNSSLIHEAIRANHMEVVEALIARGVSIHSLHDSFTPFSLAVYLGGVDALVLLLQKDANFCEQSYGASKAPLLSFAVSNGWFKVVDEILRINTKLFFNLWDKNGKTVFEYLADINDKALASSYIERLLNAGADPTMLRTPALFSSILRSNNEHLIQLYFDKLKLYNLISKAIGNAQGFLTLAVESDNAYAVRELIALGADASLDDNKGVDPLRRAIMNNKRNAAFALIQSGARYETAENAFYIGNYPYLFILIRMRWFESALAMIEKGTHLNVGDPHGSNIIYYTITSKHPPLLKAVLDRQSSTKMDFSRFRFDTLIHYIAKMGIAQMIPIAIEYYKKNNIEIPVFDSTKRTILHRAVLSKNLECVKEILAHFPELVNLGYKGGPSPFISACWNLDERGNVEIVLALLDAGAHSDQIFNSKTPLEMTIVDRDSIRYVCQNNPSFHKVLSRLFFTSKDVLRTDKFYAKLNSALYYDPRILLRSVTLSVLEACPQLHLIMGSYYKSGDFDSLCSELEIEPRSHTALRLYATSIVSKLEYDARHGRRTPLGDEKARLIRAALAGDYISMLNDALHITPKEPAISRLWSSVPDAWDALPKSVKEYISTVNPENTIKNR